MPWRLRDGDGRVATRELPHFANEQFSVTLVAETGVHAESGDVFDNRAVYVSRLDKDGKTERLWTVDLDSEDMEQFWQRNPVEGA